MRVTLYDIAKKTGYSVNTVSRVLRGDTRISAQTRGKIKLTADELGYIPNFIANSMRSQSTHTIGVISADSSNPFFAEVLLGIEETARKAGYHIILMNTEENEENECAALKVLQARQVDGLIAMPVYGSLLTRPIYEKLPVPFIFAGRKINGFENHSILHQDRQSIQKAVSHLLAAGHKNITYIGGPENISNAPDRLEGFFAAFAEALMQPEKQLVFTTRGHIDDGYAVVNKLVNQQTPFTAVVCFNDLLAMGVLKSLYEQGFSVPGDIEVIGCDNLFLSQYLQPRLSTIDVPKYKLGEAAVTELLRHIRDKNLPYNAITLETRLVLRESTRNRRNIHESGGLS